MKQVLFNSHDIVQFVTIYLCVLFALLLFSVRSKSSLSNTFLGGVLLSQAFMAFYNLVEYGEVFREWAQIHLSGIALVLELGFWIEGPLLVLYTRAMMYKNYRLRGGDTLLFLPVLYYLMVDCVFFAHDSHLMGSFAYVINDTFRSLVALGFCVWCLVEIQHYRTVLRQGFSSIDHLDYSWLRIIIVGFLAIRGWIAMYSVIGYFTFSLNFHINYDFLGLISIYATLFLISSLLFFSLSFSTMVDHLDRTSFSITGGKSPSEEGRGFTEEQVRRVLRYMESDKPYLNSQLKIDELAHQVSISSKTLSWIINRQFEKNFFEFVNDYRTEDAKKQLLEAIGKSILDIMFDVGFNSKATFNSFFKRRTGMTPSQFRKTEGVK